MLLTAQMAKVSPLEGATECINKGVLLCHSLGLGAVLGRFMHSSAGSACHQDWGTDEEFTDVELLQPCSLSVAQLYQ